MRLTLALAILGLVALSAPIAQAQDYTEEPTYGSVSLEEGFLPDPHTVSLTAGGSIEVDMGSCTYGFVADAPDVDFYYETSGGSDLYIYVDATDDTTLLINRPDGTWLCDDDGLGDANPIVAISGAVGGLYSIWVGTYGDELVEATLSMSEIDPR